MRGTDCTPGQLKSASDFVRARHVDGYSKAPKLSPFSDQQIVIRWADLVNLLAWYGALRYTAGRDGTGGTLENPGPIDSTKADGLHEKTVTSGTNAQRIITGVHCIVAPECRANRGDQGAFDEAVRRIKAEYDTCVKLGCNVNVSYHLTLGVEGSET